MKQIGIHTLKNYVEYLGAKDISGGFIPPARWNEMVPILVNKMVAKYYGLPEQYQVGMPQPAITYESTQAVIDYLSQLKAEKVYQVANTGRVTLPSDYLHKSSAVVTIYKNTPVNEDDAPTADCCYNETVQVRKQGKVKYIQKWYPVTFVSEQERWTWLASSLRKPTQEFPIAVFVGSDELQFYPTDIKQAILIYIRYPKTPVWAYTINQGIPVYNPAGSQDIELPEILADEMAVTILERLGIVIREPGLVDWSRYVKNSGK